MDVYRQASEIVRIVRDGRGTAKALCLRKEMQKKKQTYAVVCETLRHYELLEDVLNQSEFYDFYPHAKKDVAICLAYDCVIGRGINTNSDSTALAVQKCAPYLREAYERCRKHHDIAPRQRADEWEEGTAGAPPAGAPLKLPRYARVNTLKIDTETLVERLRRPKRARPEDEGKQEQQRRGSVIRGSLPAFTIDEHVPDLLVFPSGTDLHNHPSVRGSQVILQDKSSCLPACVLLGAVPCELSKPKGDKKKNTIPADAPLEYVLDACAAPGNKTTQLAALGAPQNIKLLAVERDAKRAAVLSQRVQTLNAGNYINVMNTDFFDLTSDVRDAVQGILLDPSCSASGVVSRVDINLKQHRDFLNKGAKPAEDENQPDEDDEQDAAASKKPTVSRVEKLAQVQRKLLTHALLSFPTCRRVVYSTCSVHEEENEGVVRAVLSDERVAKKGWTLTNIMPRTWRTRGLKSKDDTLPLDYTIRCDPAVDKTNGFYVSRFDRDVVEAPPVPAAAPEDGDATEAAAAAADSADTAKRPTRGFVAPKMVDEALLDLCKAQPKKMEFSSDDESD
jgi:25S rRNA (cytosine2278-C5)-methyltransferase